MQIMTHLEIRKSFLEFFSAPARGWSASGRKGGSASGGEKGHVIVASSSLIPDDQSVLLTTAGMQQFKPYFTGEKNAFKDFGSYNLVSIQKCLRTSDIDEVGDETHLTFFEMLGNFSFGGYLKEDAIKFAVEFLRDEMKIDFDRITATYFSGDRQLRVGLDKISLSELKKYFKDESKISAHGKEDNFWGPTGNEGPCGPTVEFYVDNIEVWNLVFNQYYCSVDKTLKPLDIQGVDTGMGLERLAMVLQNKKNVFETDLFAAIMEKISGTDERVKRIIADHIKASVFLIVDGVEPSNVGRGYILRRLIRRVVRYGKLLDLKKDFIGEIAEAVIEIYKNNYSEVAENKKNILRELKQEKEKFEKTLELGLKELNKLFPVGQVQRMPDENIKAFNRVDAEKAFFIYQTYGFPFEMIQEELAQRELLVDKEEFDKVFKKHQEISRAGAEEKFGGLRKEAGEKETRLHTATHLLHQALRKILGNDVRQMGSDINEARLRFDFSFGRKLASEELKKVENLVNQKIKEGLEVKMEEMNYEDAIKFGALAVFSAQGGSASGGKEKYPERVRVYSIGDPSTGSGQVFSREICGGPHAKNTAELGNFKIIKEESSSAGVRRIKAVLE